MPSPASCGGTYTDAEVEVAAILTQLAKKPHRREPCHLRWGARRRRTGAHEEGTASAGPTTSSPETPLSFPASGGDSSLPPTAASASASASASAASKNGKKRKEWVEAHEEKAASLSQGKVYLQQQIEEFKARLQKLQDFNSFLKQQKSKLQNRGTEPAPGGPGWDPVAVRVEGRRRDFDLNEAPEDDDVDEKGAWDPREADEERAHRVATSAEARRRRLEKQREKAAVAAQRAAMATAHKAPLLM